VRHSFPRHVRFSRCGDVRRQRLLLARDRVGIKPLYFANTGKALVFASEIKALLADPDVDRRINERAIDRFLTYYYLPGNETMHEGIVKLDPGHYLTVAEGRVSTRQYWDLRFDQPAAPLGFDAAAEQLRSIISSAVKDHMVSDVPVGVLLSGGVDSTAVLSHAVSHTEQPIHTFTMGFSGAGFADERPYARMAAEKFGTVHHEISMGASEFRDFLPRYVWHMEEPVCEPPAIALFFVAKWRTTARSRYCCRAKAGTKLSADTPSIETCCCWNGSNLPRALSRACCRAGSRPCRGRVGSAGATTPALFDQPPPTTT